jgi:hypothetical protein
VREPGRTADPCARDDKGGSNDPYQGPSDRMDRNSRSLRYASLRFHGKPGQAG